MFCDVLAACLPVGRTRVVTPDEEAAEAARDAGAEVVADPGGGQGPAVQAGLAGVGLGGILVVNADVPCVVPHDLRSLLAATPAGCLALVEALDGTTNALSLPSAGAFAPLYGPSSSDRFRAHGASLGLEVVSVAVPNLADDVDTMEDLTRLQLRAGPRTQACLAGAREERRLNVAVLSGGVGGARFVRGVVDVAGAAATSVIGNVGDDVEVLGLHVSPDLDSILYALAGLADEQRGWGRSDETWRALETVGGLGGEDWFALGDRDLGLHLVRTAALRAGEPLSAVTARLATALGVATRLLPATDDRLRTWLETPAGTFPFQEWFVARGHRDEVDAVRFEGEETARPAPGVLEAIGGRRSDPARAEQPVRLGRADPRGARAARRARPAARALRRRQPADRRPRGEGPGRPDAAAARAAGRRRGTSRPATRA